MSWSERLRKKINDFEFLELLKGGSIALILKIVGTLLFYALTLIITNSKGASDYGEFAFFITTTKVLSIILVFGTDTSALRTIARNIDTPRAPEVVNSLSKSYEVILLFGALILISALLFQEQLCRLLDVEPYYLFAICLVALLFGLVKVHAQAFRGLKKIAHYGIIEFALISLLTLLGIAILVLGKQSLDLFGLIVIYFGAVLLTALFSFIAWLKVTGMGGSALLRSMMDTSFKKLMAYIQFSSSFLLATSITMFSFWLMQFLLKYYHSSVEVGIYDIVSKLCMFITLPLFAVSAIIAPKLSSNYSGNEMKRFNANVRQGTLLSLSLGGPVALFLLLFPTFSLSLFGEEFTSGALALKILILGYFFNVASGPLSLALQMANHEKIFRNIVFA
ncbi:MAG: oligosaccharide flippase family protein, partial [Bacteroidota bacterium]